jgi:hypothetical protein
MAVARLVATSSALASDQSFVGCGPVHHARRLTRTDQRAEDMPDRGTAAGLGPDPETARS